MFLICLCFFPTEPRINFCFNFPVTITEAKEKNRPSPSIPFQVLWYVTFFSVLYSLYYDTKFKVMMVVVLTVMIKKIIDCSWTGEERTLWPRNKNKTPQFLSWLLLDIVNVSVMMFYCVMLLFSPSTHSEPKAWLYKSRLFSGLYKSFRDIFYCVCSL